MEFDSIVTRYQLQLIKNKRHPNNNNELVPWNWVCSNFINLLEKYASGATEAILVSELQALWDETPEDWNEISGNRITGLAAIGEAQTGGILEVKVTSIRCIGGTHVWAVTVEDSSGSRMDHYLHPQFSDLVDGPCPLLVPGRGLRMVGARASTMGSPPRPVLLPTQHLSVLLGTVANVFDGHLTDPLETLPLAELSQFRGTSGACIIAAKVMDIRGNNIYLCDSSVRSPNYITLELPQAHAQVVKLVRKGEVLRMSPKIPEAFGIPHTNHLIIEYIPGSLLCVQANPLGTNTESVLDGPGIRSMHYVKARLSIGDIHARMSGISILARVVSKGHNKPTANNDRYPLMLCDIPSAGHSPRTLDVTVWDNAWMLRGLRPGMLIYAENLFAAEEKESTSTSHNRNYYVVASKQRSSRLRPISSLPGLLSSSLFPITPLSSIIPLANSTASFARLPSNFVVRATILDYSIMGTESPVFTAHLPCMRVTHNVDERSQVWKCAFCNVSSHPSARGEWEKVFVMQWKISDGSAECLVSASPRVHELILQIRASSFVELDGVEQKARIIAAFASNYLFSLSVGIEGQKRTIRIDQLVTPNPIVETYKLVDDLSSLL